MPILLAAAGEDSGDGGDLNQGSVQPVYLLLKSINSMSFRTSTGRNKLLRNHRQRTE